MSDVLLLVTGGTLDKVHDTVREELIFSYQTHLNTIVEECKIQNVHVDVLMLKDSWDITDEDRQIILEACQNASAEKIVITHGTSTMAETGQFLKENGLKDKTVVLTGALRPYSFLHSDAKFNLGMAVATARLSTPGIYITMSGGIFPADQVRKNPETGIFEAV